MSARLSRSPANAGAQGLQARRLKLWAPAFAGERVCVGFSETVA
jgi:hypothetical protein